MKLKLLISILIAVVIGVSCPRVANSQVVIALLFGEKLNTPDLKFGLDGGINFYSMSNVSSPKSAHGLNLGLYFDILLKQNSNWYMHTGLILKSPMGGDGLAPYSLNDAVLDTMFQTGNINRQLRYLNIPILLRYQFKNQLFLEAGPMFGVLVKATDGFYNTVTEDEDISYNNNIYDQCNKFDAGGMAGIGYHLMKGTGLNLGIRYYAGFTNIIKDGSLDAQQNNSLYAYISIPIGAGEKAKAKNAAKDKKKKEKK